MKQVTETYLKVILSWIRRNPKYYELFGYDMPKHEFKDGFGYIDENDLWNYHVVRKYVKDNTIHQTVYPHIPFNPRPNAYGSGHQEEN